MVYVARAEDVAILSVEDREGYQVLQLRVEGTLLEYALYPDDMNGWAPELRARIEKGEPTNGTRVNSDLSL